MFLTFISHTNFIFLIFTLSSRAMNTILVVDDNADIRLLVSLTLENEHVRIVEASTAADAIARCAELKPDLIIMDVNMPGGMNGIEAARVITSNPLTANCPIIMLSGVSNPSIQSKALEAGASTFLKKPFSPLELIETVEDTIAGSVCI